MKDFVYSPTVEEQNELEATYRKSREREDNMPAPGVAWVPQPGAQVNFLQCPLREVLLHGPRGSGKTDPLIMDFAQDVGKGYGDIWRGILFRKTYPQLGDVVAKSHRWFKKIFPAATFNWSRMAWIFPTGETLLFRHMAKPDDYWNYHGHEYPWQGWEELSAWSDDQCYTRMFACNRASTNVPRRIRATTNPYGVGSNWIKERWRLAGQWWKTIVIPAVKDSEGEIIEHERAAIPGRLEENKILLETDKTYRASVRASASNTAMAKAWLLGSWDIIAGGMFDDVWTRFNLWPDFDPPSNWYMDRSFDWGSSKPFSVGWWVESDGSDVQMRDGSWRSTVPGDLFRIREWYGWTGKANEGNRMLTIDIAAGIVEREIAWGWRAGVPRINPGPADSSIFDVVNGNSYAMDMEKPVRIGDQYYDGVSWTEADKRPGSRKMGWGMIRQMMKNARRPKNGPREYPGLFVVGEHCPQFLRTVLSLPRKEDDLDDVDTNAEDHIGDETRYRVRNIGNELYSGKTSGMTR